MEIKAADVMELRKKTGAGVADCKKALTEADGDMDKAVDLLRERGVAIAQKKASRIAAEGVAFAKVEGKVGVLTEVNCETDFVAKGEQFQAFVAEVADYALKNDLKSDEELINAKSDAAVAITAKTGEKVSIRRFAKFTTDNGVIDAYIHLGNKIGVMIEVTGCTCDGTKALAHDIAMQIAFSKPAYLVPEDVPAEVIDKEKEILLAQIENDPKLCGKPDMVKQKMVEGRVGKFYEENCLMKLQFFKEPSLTIEKLVANASKEMGKDLKVKRFVRFEVGEGMEKRNEDFAAEVAKQMKK